MSTFLQRSTRSLLQRRAADGLADTSHPFQAIAHRLSRPVQSAKPLNRGRANPSAPRVGYFRTRQVSR